MPTTRKVIALAGVGDLGRYVSEELHASNHFDCVILTRGVCVSQLIMTRLIATP